MARKLEKMKKNLLSFIALSILIFSACAQQKKTTASKKSSKVVTKQAKESQIQQITMERTPCFGTCPSYRLDVNMDGKVVFTSRAFTEFEGTYEKKFAAEKATAIFKKFETYQVDTCSEEYNSLIADVPGVFYTIKYANKEQHINNAHFGPEYLNDLANELDANFKVDDTWTKTAEAEKQ